MQHNVGECAKCGRPVHTSQPFLRDKGKLFHWVCFERWLELNERVKTSDIQSISQRRPA